MTILFSLGFQPAWAGGPYMLEIKAPTREARTDLVARGFAIDEVRDSSVFVIGSNADMQTLQSEGRLLQAIDLTIGAKRLFRQRENYRGFERIQVQLAEWAGDHSDIMQLSTLGQSYEQRQLWLVTLSTADDHRENPAVVFVAGHHAREHVSMETAMNWIEHLITGYREGDARVRDLLQSRTVYVVPVLNPDGAIYDLAGEDFRYWRKNRRMLQNTVGVDLNRNYGFNFGGLGSSDDPKTETYRGPAPFSEPETRAFRDFVLNHENITILASFHTYSELILYPWGYTYDPVANSRDRAVHQVMAQTMGRMNGYRPQQSSDLYVTSGDTTDWSYGELGIISFTFELDPKDAWIGGGFYPYEGTNERVFRKNREPCLYMVDLADNPYRALQSESQRYGLQSNLFEMPAEF